MATAYEVFGPCVPQTGTGTNNAMETLGVCRDGGQIRIQYVKDEIKSDAAGGARGAPAELQALGKTARVTMQLPSKDVAVVAKCRFRSEGGATDGLAPAPGLLLGTSGSAFGLYLPSSLGTPWFFPFCVLEDPGLNQGTRFAEDELTFFAWRFVAGSAATVAGVKLYQRSAPP